MGSAYRKKPKPKSAGIILYEKIDAIAAKREQLRKTFKKEPPPSDKKKLELKAKLEGMNAELASLQAELIEAFGLQQYEGKYRHLVSTIRSLRDGLPSVTVTDERNLVLYSSKEKRYIQRDISKTLDMLHKQLLEIENIIDNDVVYFSHLLPTYIEMNPNGGSEPLGEIKHLLQIVKKCRSKITQGNQKKNQRWFDNAMDAIATFWGSCGKKFSAEYNSDIEVISKGAAFSYCTLYVALPDDDSLTKKLIKEASKEAYGRLNKKG